MRARVLSAMMCKGGVGKTTVALLTSYFLSKSGRKVLLIDTDPQGNLTLSALSELRDRVHEKTPVLMDVLSGICDWSDAIIRFEDRMDLVPSTALNSLLDRKLLSVQGPLFKLRTSLSALKSKYDFIILDSAPNLNLFNASLIVASDELLLPINLDDYSRAGLEQTLSEIEDLKSKLGLAVDPRILVNKYSPNSESLYYLGLLAERHRPLLLQSMIRNSRQSQQIQSGSWRALWDQRSNLRQDFYSLVQELNQGVSVTDAEI